MPLLSTITDRNPLDTDEPLFLDEPAGQPPLKRREQVEVSTLFRDEVVEIDRARPTPPAPAGGRRPPPVLLVALALAFGFALVTTLLF